MGAVMGNTDTNNLHILLKALSVVDGGDWWERNALKVKGWHRAMQVQ